MPPLWGMGDAVKKVYSILLHDVAVSISLPDYGSPFQEFHTEKYALSYPFSAWAFKVLTDEFTAMRTSLTDEDLAIERQYQSLECIEQVLEICAHVVQPHMLEIEILWAKDSQSKEPGWKQKVTYCGGFSVSWATDE
jgi:hypothetical protein